MQLRHHIDTLEGLSWYRCQSTELVGELVRWELNPNSRYDLAAAYERRPHRQFIQAADDKALLVFLRAWGPLEIELRKFSGETPLAYISAERDKLTAWARLLASIEGSADLYTAVLDLLRLDAEPFAVWIQLFLGLRADPKAGLTAELESRLTNASQRQIEDICKFLVGTFPAGQFGQSLVIERVGKRLHLRATVRFLGLLDALYWMTAQDVFRKEPFSFCVECGKLIPLRSRHPRRFCEDPKTNCARRWTDREWKRRKRAEERDEKQKSQARKGR
jgi:hypothetical protein